MPSVFNYTDFRQYLKDWYTEQKSSDASFSYNSFALDAGFKNKGFLHNVLHGRKNISKSSVFKLASLIKLRSNEAEYFENLVFFNQAEDTKEKTHYFEKLNEVQVRGVKLRTIRQVRIDQYKFYSQWHHSAVRALIGMYPLKSNYRWLARSIFPAISVWQAKQSVKLLESLGMIKRKEGVYVLTDSNISTGEEVRDISALNFHRSAIKQALGSVDSVAKNKRNISGLTVGISKETYGRIVDEVANFRKKLVDLVNHDTQKAEQVYQINFQVFPFSRTDIAEKLNKPPRKKRKKRAA